MALGGFTHQAAQAVLLWPTLVADLADQTISKEPLFKAMEVS